MTNAEMKKNRLATIHKDLAAVTTAIQNAARDVRNGRSTIKAASEEYHTAANDEIAARLDRMTLNTTDIGFGLRTKIRDCLLAYSYQRDNCKRNRAQFIQQGQIVSALAEGGMFQELIALRKAAKAAAAAGEELAPALDVVVATGEEAAPAVERPVNAVVYFKGTEKGGKGPAVSMKHVTMTKDVNSALVEALTAFDVVGPVRVFINDVEVSGMFANEVLKEIRQELKAKADLIERIESRLKADGVDFFNEGEALACLGECVAPTKLKAVYLEELAKRRAVTFGLDIGRRVHTPVGPARVVEFDKWNVGQVKIKFDNGSGCTTTHYSKVIPC